LVFLVIFLSIQSSSLWGRLIVVPLSLSLVITLNLTLLLSGVLALIFILVFIGGLLVFLVRVSTLLSQEPITTIIYIYFFLLFRVVFSIVIEKTTLNSIDFFVTN